MEFYEYRKLQNKHLVKVEYVRKSNANGFCNNKEVYKIYTERIHVRLSEIEEINFVEALVMLMAALEGLNNVKDAYEGILNLVEEMVGVN